MGDDFDHTLSEITEECRKFEVGDRVRVILNTTDDLSIDDVVGEEGVIQAVEQPVYDDIPIFFRPDGEDSYGRYVSPFDIEKIDPEPKLEPSASDSIKAILDQAAERVAALEADNAILRFQCAELIKLITDTRISLRDNITAIDKLEELHRERNEKKEESK